MLNSTSQIPRKRDFQSCWSSKRRYLDMAMGENQGRRALRCAGGLRRLTPTFFFTRGGANHPCQSRLQNQATVCNNPWPTRGGWRVAYVSDSRRRNLAGRSKWGNAWVASRPHTVGFWLCGRWLFNWFWFLCFGYYSCCSGCSLWKMTRIRSEAQPSPIHEVKPNLAQSISEAQPSPIHSYHKIGSNSPAAPPCVGVVLSPFYLFITVWHVSCN